MGLAKVTAHRNMRMRFLLKHPQRMKGHREFMRALTEREGYGIEFVERLVVERICGPIIFAAVVALVVTIVYGQFTGDWPGGCSIGCTPFPV